MITVGMKLTSKTNTSKEYEVIAVADGKATLLDLKTDEEKELKLRTVERNYNFDAADAQPADENVEEQKTENKKGKKAKEEPKDKEDETEEDDTEAKELEKAAAKALKEEEKKKKAEEKAKKAQELKESKEKLKAEKAEAAKEKSLTEKKALIAELPKEFVAEYEANAENVALLELSKSDLKQLVRKSKPSGRGRAKEVFEDLETEEYSKKVTETNEDGKLIRIEAYTGKDKNWHYERHTKNNSFNKAILMIDEEKVKLPSPSKSNAAAKIAEVYGYKEFKLL